MIEIERANQMKAYLEGLLQVDLSCVKFLCATGIGAEACAQCFVYTDVETGWLERIRIVLYLDDIKDSAEYEGMDEEVYLNESIYHELIHAIHAVVYNGQADMYDQVMSHEGKLWNDLVTIGLSEEIITREAI